MASKTRNILLAPYTGELPAALYFRSASMPDHGFYPPHHHPWGEFVSAVCGVLEVQYAGGHYVIPSHYGIWLPPNTEHLAQNRKQAWHSSVYISATECAAMPVEVTALTISPLIRAMLEHLHRHPPGLVPSEEETRFLRVLVDLLAKAERVGSYLPSSNDPLVQKVLTILESKPGDSRSVAELAKHAHTSERTLMRHCQRDLGMSLAEWRQRLRVIKAMPLLEAGWTVESIALEFGYASSSAFITMFRRLTNETPDEYRQRALGLER